MDLKRNFSIPVSDSCGRLFVREFAHHGARDDRYVDIGGAPTPLYMAITQHRDPVGECKHFVQSVRHENHRGIVGHDRPNGTEQALRFGFDSAEVGS